MGAEAVRRGTNREIATGFRQLKTDLRGPSRRRISHRNHRLVEEPATGAGRPDSRASDACAKTSGTGQEDHRRPVGYRARAGGPRPAAAAAGGGGEHMKRLKARDDAKA